MVYILIAFALYGVFRFAEDVVSRWNARMLYEQVLRKHDVQS